MVFSSNLMRDLIASLPYRLSTTEPALAQGAAIVGQHNGPFYKITERQNLSRFALRTSQCVRTNTMVRYHVLLGSTVSKRENISDMGKHVVCTSKY